MKRYFITGTDTDCGKTYITRNLLDAFPHSVAIKPIASGCVNRGGEQISADALCLSERSSLTLEQINPWRYTLPISPHLAARHEGHNISLDELSAYCMGIDVADKDTLFIEGAGGLMVPLNNQETWIDFLKQTQIPVILVVGMRLGCINHALLTESVLMQHEIACTGWIANCLDPEMQFLDENIETLKEKLTAPLIAVNPFASSLVFEKY